MDAKITLSFNRNVISNPKRQAQKNHISLSRLVEFLLQQATTTKYQSLQDFRISEWVSRVAKGKTVYQTKKEPVKNRFEILFNPPIF